VIFQIGSISPEHALRLTLKALEKHDRLPKTWGYLGDKKKKIPTNRMLEKVGESERLGFVIESDGLQVRFGSVANYEHIFLSIEELRANALNNGDRIVAALLGEPGFIQAWLADAEYSSWQNAEDILVYELEGKDYSHLPLTTRDLPPPLDQEIIDISGNPGRRILRTGYVEAVGATMWLGEPFWALVGEQRRDDILAAEWAETTQLENGVLRIQVAPDCFRDESNKDIQVKLRRTLYGVD
jgi:hypothetical protein